ncbi:MAG TPA: mannose-1-phosphate guanyltransferase [Chloroflexota bacterium]|nr:mannose-1-phosphate guanyltransferase [Chloroflexota bacterium]
MKAVVMAGGEGSRLRPLTINRPKPMVPIVNKPVMEHVLDLLRRHGITDVVVTVQYLASVIQDYFGDGSHLGMNISYSVEETPLGTAGSVKLAEELLRDDTFLVISGDALTDFDLTRIVENHKANKAKATLTLYHVPNPLEYGVVIVDDEGRIRQFLEKPGWGEVFSDTVNTGIYVLEPSIFDYYPAGKPVDFSQDVFPQLLARGDALYGYVADGYWCDVGNIPEFLRANADLLSGKVRLEPLGRQIGEGIWVESDTVEIASNAQLYGPVWFGDSAKVKDGVVVRGPAVIRDDTILDSRAQVDRSVIWRNSYIGERAEVRGAIIGRQCSIKSKVMVFEGTVIGDGTTIDEGAIVQPNVKIWPNKEIEAGATVNRSIIWGSQARRAIFGRWGVSGLVNIEILPEFAAKLGAAYGSILPRGATVTFNRDGHRSSRMIKRAMMAGLPSAGVHVLDIRALPIPVARWVTNHSDATAGVHVRVSPFDERVVDIKFFDGRGLDLDRNTERKIEGSFFREDYRRAYLDEVGRIGDSPNIWQGYVDALCEVIKPPDGESCTLVVDYANGPASLILPQVLNRGDCNVVALNGSVDETRLAHTVEEFDDLLHQLARISQGINAHWAARLDVGGEKLYVIDDRGEIVPGWSLLGAIADMVYQRHPGATIAVPVTAPSVFEKIAERHGGSVVRTRTSAQSLMSVAAREKVMLAGDGDGGIIFPDFQPAMDGLYALAKLHGLLHSQGCRLSEVLAELPPYYVARTKVPCSWDDKGKVMRMLSQQFSDRTKQIDGIKIDLDGEWVLVLPDVDRPIFHIIAESDSNENARVLMDKYAALVSSLQR